MNEDCNNSIRKVAEVQQLLQGKWKLQVLCAMRQDPVRLGRLLRLIPGASKKGLRASLRELERAGIVVRRDMSNTILHVEYDFADDIRDIVGTLLDQLETWGGILEARRKGRQP